MMFLLKIMACDSCRHNLEWKILWFSSLNFRELCATTEEPSLYYLNWSFLLRRVKFALTAFTIFPFNVSHTLQLISMNVN